MVIRLQQSFMRLWEPDGVAEAEHAGNEDPYRPSSVRGIVLQPCLMVRRASRPLFLNWGSLASTYFVWGSAVFVQIRSGLVLCSRSLVNPRHFLKQYSVLHPQRRTPAP